MRRMYIGFVPWTFLGGVENETVNESTIWEDPSEAMMELPPLTSWWRHLCSFGSSYIYCSRLDILVFFLVFFLAVVNFWQHTPHFHRVSSHWGKKMRPFCWYVALDGRYVVSYSGGAGVLKVEFPSCRVTARYYHGLSYGHAVDVSPDGRWIFLGNFSQQIAIIEASSLELVARLPLSQIQDFDSTTFRLQAPVFVEWISNLEFLIALSDTVWRVTLTITGSKLVIQESSTLSGKPKSVSGLQVPTVSLAYSPVCKHNCDAPHQIIWAAKSRTLLLADAGNEESRPRRVELIQLQNDGSATNKMLYFQDDVWHMAMDKTVGTKVYASTYSKFDYTPYQIRDRSKYFGVGFEREYVYEICTDAAKIVRMFSGSVAVPLHLNSDMVVTNNKLLIACGSAHDAFELDLEDFASWRTVPGGPGLFSRWVNIGCWVNWIQNLVDGLTHFPFLLQPIMILLRTNSFRLMNGIYAIAVSPCEKYICLGHRDCNFVRLVEAKSHITVAAFFLPMTPGIGAELSFGGMLTRHGLHHSRTATFYQEPKGGHLT